MNRLKTAILFIVLSLMFSPQVFAARGVDYNGAGQSVTIAGDATGLKVGTGQSIYLANGSTFVTGAGALTLPGSSTIQSLTVNPGNITVTAGSISVPSGSITVSADVNAGTVNAGNVGVTYNISSAGKMTAGNGMMVTSGSTTITAGNLLLSSGNVNIVGTSKGVSITNGNLGIETGNVQIATGGLVVTTGTIEILSGDIIADDGKLTIHGQVKQWSNSNVYVESLAGTATAREGVRLLKSGAGNAAAIGSTYRSSATGKMYIKATNSHVDTDWQLISSTDAD